MYIHQKTLFGLFWHCTSGLGWEGPPESLYHWDANMGLVCARAGMLQVSPKSSRLFSPDKKEEWSAAFADRLFVV